eukprot:CAMPEP_0204271838 /NCGR_PEP_ID=MMETSP0468-20130131/21235_1 /ASSEMBLY_ACC=CAM_ASM_000383 /TAXON_ID=2969 /ORGANISM="Oxyrrhis marina" /LENGTH=450 /DNA_ID=CAMNT_0051247595 /DNA_START=71 /DNA_END=1423 /DNA_ORIENTATION=-
MRLSVTLAVLGAGRQSNTFLGVSNNLIDAADGAAVEIELESIGEMYRASRALSVGSPAQHLPCIFDTGSFDVLTFSQRCLGDCNYQSDPEESYNPEKSTSFDGFSTVKLQQDGDIRDHLLMMSFGQGDCAVLPAHEQVQVEGSGGTLKVGSMPIMEGVWAQDSFRTLMDSHVTAVVGLGKSRKAGAESDPTDGPTLLEELKVDTFSMCYGLNEAPGYLLLNDPAFQGGASPAEAVEANVIGNVHWGVGLTGIKMGDKTVGCDGNRCAAIVDSGTSVLMLPRATVLAIMQEVEKHKIGQHCEGVEALPNLEFAIDGPSGAQLLSLPPSVYMVHMEGEVPTNEVGESILQMARQPATTHVSACLPTVMPSDRDTDFGPLAILGLPMFQQYIVSFHPEPNPWKMHFRPTAKAGKCITGAPQSVLEGGVTGRVRKVDPSNLPLPRWSGGAKVVM